MVFKFKKFTLVELLVVISVLVLLASLIQPTFKKMMTSAHTLDCLTKLQKMGAAIMIYAEDHSGNLPTVTSAFGLAGKKGTQRGGTRNPKNRVLNDYLNHEYETLQCPADIGDTINGVLLNESTFDAYGTSYNPAYSTRGGVRAAFSRTKPMNLLQIDSVHNKFLLADWPWGIWRDAKDDTTKRHGGDISRVLNILFADGHASNTDFTYDYELHRFSMRPDKNWIWW